MTSVHPITYDTIIQVDGLRSPSQQVENIWEKVEKEQSDVSSRDESDQDETADKKSYSGESIAGEIDELNDNKIDMENNRTDRSAERTDASSSNNDLTSDLVNGREQTADNSTNNRNSSASSKASSHTSSNVSSVSVLDSQDDKNTSPNRGHAKFKPLINGLNKLIPNGNSKQENAKEQFTFIWSNLSYFVYIPTSRFGLRKKKKFIFDRINGQLRSNQIFGLLGPSGAGKSSLLDCLSFKRLKNVSGTIKINGQFKRQYKMAYIPQHDEYLEDLTCLEILMYASKLKNSSASIEDTLLTLNKDVIDQQRRQSIQKLTFHHRVAKNVLKLLGLSEQIDTYAGRLSGGQKKRLSIAQELVVKPNIIFLDEPTSGLDSSSSYQCISLLSQLAKHSTPIAIVATIHQPNPKTLELFDQIYVLSSNGRVVYNASPFDMLSRLSQANISVPMHYNPADFLLELASGEYDPSYIARMAEQVKRTEIKQFSGEETRDAIRAFEMHSPDNFRTHFNILLNRCFLLTMRNPMLTTNRILSHFLLALFIGWIFGPDVGKHADCPAKMSLSLDAEELAKLTNHRIESSKNVVDNMSSIFFGILVMLLGGLLPTLVTFPLEVKILQKEVFNHWYNVKPYFYARFIADLLLQILVPFMYAAITYLLNGQLLEEFRFINFSLIFVLTAAIAQTHGVIVSAIFSENITTAVYLGPITALPLLLFSGFLVRIERMPWIIRPFTYLSYMRFSFEGLVIAIYGFNRCGDEAIEEITRIRKLLDSYFTNLMNLVQAGINCEEDWDKANLVLSDTNLTMMSHQNLRLDELDQSIAISGSSQQMMQAPVDPENKTENGINTLFSNMLDLLFNNKKDENGKILPAVMQLFDLKDVFLYRAIIALLIFTVVTRIISYYLIKYKANLRR